MRRSPSGTLPSLVRRSSSANSRLFATGAASFVARRASTVARASIGSVCGTTTATREDGIAPEHRRRKGVTMGETALTSRVRRRIRDVGVGLVLSAVVMQPGHAQSPVSFSALTGQPNLTGLPGLNGAQQIMAQSINNVCPTINTIAVTPNQRDLATLCSAMIGNSSQVQGQNTMGLPSLGLNTSGLQGALQQLNGGAELVVPTSQTSVTQTTQTTRQTGAIEERLSQLRNLTTGTVLAGAGSPQAGQIAALSTLEPDGRIIVEPGAPLQFAYSTGPLGVFVNGLGQFGSRDITSTVNAFFFQQRWFHRRRRLSLHAATDRRAGVWLHAFEY
jgi:hypothetical protein